MNVDELLAAVRRGVENRAALDEAQRQANAAGKAICVKCGRVFTTCQEYRFNAQGRLICRRPCRERRP
jgi:hypothetical protein